jgi:radical SAM enzyme (rSAM/lipoprotein system)
MATLRRLLHPLYRQLETKVHPLRYLFVEVTQRCNLDCLHCGSDCGRELHHDELSVDEWVDFFGTLPRHFDSRKLMLVVTGGEPLCHPQFDRLATALADNQLAWGMVTNGWAVTPEKLTRYAGQGLVSLTISLDGLEDVHDWLRGREGSFARATRAIEAAVATQVRAFDVVTCVNPRNLDTLDDIARHLEELGVRNWRLFSIFAKGRAAENSELILNDDQFRTMLDWLAKYRQRGTSLHADFSCEGFLPAATDTAVRNEPYFCRAGICIGSVLCDGAISACPNISRSFIQGNIRTDDFKTVWESQYQAFRNRDWMKVAGCADCNHWSRCRGNSLHLWDETTATTGRCLADMKLSIK